MNNPVNTPPNKKISQIALYDITDGMVIALFLFDSDQYHSVRYHDRVGVIFSETAQLGDYYDISTKQLVSRNEHRRHDNA